MARAGGQGAAQISKALARIKGGAWGASRANVMTRLIIECLTGEPVESVKSPAMDRGYELEDDACLAYEMRKGVFATRVGLAPSDDRMAHASPDRFIDDGGILELN